MQFLGLAGRDSVGEMQAFIDRHGVDAFPHLVDDDGSLWERFGVITQPSWVFVNDDGTVRDVVGILGEDGLTEEIDRLVAS